MRNRFGFLSAVMFMMLPMMMVGQYALETDINLPTAQVPTNYVIPAVTIAGTDRSEVNLTSDIDVTDNAHASDDSIGLSQVIVALETYITDSIAVQELGLDTTTFNVSMVIDLRSVQRYNPSIVTSRDIWLLGDEKYRVRYNLKWKVE